MKISTVSTAANYLLHSDAVLATPESYLGILEDSVDHVDPVAVALVRHIDEGDLQRDNILRRHLRPGPQNTTMQSTQILNVVFDL
jgi:hypothetical protein